MAADGFGHTGGRKVAEILEKRAEEVCGEYKREGRERGTSRQDKTSEVWYTESQGRRKEGHSRMLLSVNDKKEECFTGFGKKKPSWSWWEQLHWTGGIRSPRCQGIENNLKEGSEGSGEKEIIFKEVWLCLEGEKNGESKVYKIEKKIAFKF